MKTHMIIPSRMISLTIKSFWICDDATSSQLPCNHVKLCDFTVVPLVTNSICLFPSSLTSHVCLFCLFTYYSLLSRMWVIWDEPAHTPSIFFFWLYIGALDYAWGVVASKRKSNPGTPISQQRVGTGRMKPACSLYFWSNPIVQYFHYFGCMP